MTAQARYEISADVAWVEASDLGSTPHLVWAAQLETATQFAFTDTAWLVWMLLSDGVSTVPALRRELDRIHDELGPDVDRPSFADASLQDFLDALIRDGLIRLL